jgi:ATP-dependent DNA helicase RecG
MRPSVLDPLFAPVGALSGIGPKTAKLFDRLLATPGGAARVVDLLFHLPHSFSDRRNRPTIAAAPLDQMVVLEARVTEHRPPGGRYSKAPYRVLVEDDTGDVQLVFFLANREWIERSLPLGATRWISGRLELWDGHRQMVHPDRVLDAEGLAKLRPLEPVYGLTEGLSAGHLRRATEAALARLPKLPEWLDPAFQTQAGFARFDEALRELHYPSEPGDVALDSLARKRVAYDELLSQQLALRLVRAKMRGPRGRASAGDGRIARRILDALPFGLTGAQTRALAEIRADLSASTRMVRLLQGDVGAGKTIVGLLAMAHVVEAGRQAAMMAPTEILARQHFERIEDFAKGSGLRVALLTGRDRPAARERTKVALAAGEIDIVVGTHALVQDDVAFRDLGLAIVDEQHRFGVHQRLALGDKGEATDILVMTATPIPRTLVLTYFGDMDVSKLDEKPPGRLPIPTRAVPIERIDDLVASLARAIDGGARAYWVCPIVEESEDSDLAAATERQVALRAVFGARVGLIHGRMKGPDKDAAMAAFKSGETQILVATTVIEVGVDVPEATIMIVEHAERFGLSQLHQLRGRVGRGASASSCVLLYKGPLGETARARLAILRESEDGFRLAEEDLRLRGEGEILGSRQSGTPGFRLADLSVHADLARIARDDADLVLSKDPALAGPRGKALRVLLYLFERDEAVRLLRAG